jgi:hypothetical protein
MADLNKGQTFLDLSAINFFGTKGKFFIALSDAEDEDDLVVCFVMNTEHRMDKYNLLCNKNQQRFIIAPSTFSFVSEYTSIMLVKEVFYEYSEFFHDHIKLKDVADDLLVRQIKNCLDFNYLTPKAAKLIKDSFKLHHTT